MIAAAIMAIGNPAGGGVPPGGIPVAAFSTIPSPPLPGATTQFIDQSTNGPSEWLWTINGAQVAVTQNFSYYFPFNGLYVVGLTASNLFGSGSTSIPIYVFA